MAGLGEDVDGALKKYAELKLRQPQSYYSSKDDGQLEENYFFSLGGTIPTLSRNGEERATPVTVWLRNNHPAACPIVCATPSSVEKKGVQVDGDGRVDMDYLSQWNAETSELTVLIDTLCVALSEVDNHPDQLQPDQLQPAPDQLQPAPDQMQPDQLQPDQLQPAPDQLQPAPDQMQPDQLQPAPDQLQPAPDQLQPAPDQLQPDQLQPDQLQPAPDQLQPAPDQLQPAPDQLQPAPEQFQPTPNQLQSTPDQLQLPDFHGGDEGGAATASSAGTSENHAREGTISTKLASHFSSLRRDFFNARFNRNKKNQNVINMNDDIGTGDVNTTYSDENKGGGKKSPSKAVEEDTLDPSTPNESKLQSNANKTEFPDVAERACTGGICNPQEKEKKLSLPKAELQLLTLLPQTPEENCPSTRHALPSDVKESDTPPAIPVPPLDAGHTAGESYHPAQQLPVALLPPLPQIESLIRELPAHNTNAQPPVRPRAVVPHEQPELNLHELNWEFEDPKPEACVICVEVMIEPHLTKCCGNGYVCRKCTDTVKQQRMSCPFCQSHSFDTQVDQNHLYVVLNSQVSCPCTESGCRWKGLFRDAAFHLETCAFHEVSCPNKCDSIKFQRRRLEDHLRECPLQSVACPYVEAGCGDAQLRKNVRLHLNNSVHKHLLQVAHQNCAASRECTALEQWVVERHEEVEKCMDEDIRDLRERLSQAKRDISRLGKRIDGVKREVGGLQRHQETTNASFIDLLIQNGEKMQGLTNEQDALLDQFTRFPASPLNYNEIPTTFTLGHLSELKENNEMWLSPAFYTHTGGYKMRLSVYPNGNEDGHGKYASIYLHLTRGEFDDTLKWPMQPFLLQVTVKNNLLLSRVVDPGDKGNLKTSFPWDAMNSVDFRRRVEGSGIGQGWGAHCWISHSDLGRYMTADCLIICVASVTFLPQ